MIFFDFLFYRICKFYSQFKEKGAESSSAGILGGLQTLNLLTVYWIVESLHKDRGTINVFLVIGVFLFFQVYTYIRYIYSETNSSEHVEKKWLKKSELYRKRSVIFQYIYVTLSIFSCFGIAIYLGAKH